jgi:hypothetical protein
MRGSIWWKDGKSDEPWAASINDKNLGNFRTSEEAKEAVERDAKKQANTILLRLQE